MPDPTTTDAPVKTPDVAKEVPPAPAAAALNEASKNSLDDVKTAISGPSTIGTDGHPKVADKTDPTAAEHEHEHDGIAAAALDAYDPKALTHKSSPQGEARSHTEPDHLDFAAADKGDKGDKGAQVVVKDGQIAVNNDRVAATRATDGTDTVTDKKTGETVIRDAAGDKISDTAADRTTDIHQDHVTDKFANLNIKRETTTPLDGTPPKAGDAKQGSDGISYADSTGGGTAAAKNNDTLTLTQTNGDQLVLNSDTNQVTLTKNGQPAGAPMSLDDYTKANGSQFGNFHLDSTSQVTDTTDGAVLQAQNGTASLAKTNPTGGDVVKASVNANGTSEMQHLDAQGKVLSDSTINYNDPTHAYQQLDAQGNVIANYNANDNSYQGNGFGFNNSGMSINNGNVLVGDDGSYSADSYADSVTSDSSLSLYTASGMDASQIPTVSADITADLQSALLLDPTDVDALSTLSDMTGNKLVGLDAKVADLEDQADRKGTWQERQAARDGRDNTSGSSGLNASGLLDFTQDNIYGNNYAA